MKNVVLVGAGQHAIVVLNILKQYSNIELIGFTDIDFPKRKTYKSYPILGVDECLLTTEIKNKVEYAFITVGSTGNNNLRKCLFNKVLDFGYKFLNIIDKNSIVAEDVEIGKGNMISPGVIINSEVIIGKNNIINTGAIIEHGCKIKDHIHIAPGAKLAGNVNVGSLTHIGLGANIIENVTIGTNCLIGAGTVVIKDIPDNSIVVGVPGKVIKKR